MKFLKKCFIIGLITAVLFGFIFWILKFIWSLLIPFKFISILIFGKYLFGLEIFVLFVFIIIVGLLINFWERKSGPIEQKTIIHKILSFFQAIKITVSRWFDGSQKPEGIYVAVEISPGISALGITSYNTFNLANEDKIAVALVSWPFPTTGPMIVFVSRNKIKTLDHIPPEIIIQLIMTATMLKFKDEASS